MRLFSELTAQDLLWTGDLGNLIPVTGDFHLALHAGQEVVATAHITWQRMEFFNVSVESGDGVHLSNMDLTRPERPTMVWRQGGDKSLLAMKVTWEEFAACGGEIDTDNGRSLLIEPTHRLGYEYAIFPQGGARILTLAAANSGFGLGGNPGHMSIESASATDPDLPALVTLAFTVANEVTRLLHKPA